MLVLTRKPTEYITIGPDIAIKIIRVKGQYIRIGVIAPGELNIRRCSEDEYELEDTLSQHDPDTCNADGTAEDAG